MAKSNAFEDYIYEETQRALETNIATSTDQIYALSFFIYDVDDNPLIPTLTVGYNTENQMQAHIKKASSANEARWNYAFWLHNSILKIGPYDGDNKQLQKIYSGWIRSLGINFSASQLDELQDKAEEHDDDDAIEMLEDAMTLVRTQFTDICCRVSLRLHAEGIIKALFGRAVPIIVHELEYYDAIANQTEKANPVGLAQDFCKWVRKL